MTDISIVIPTLNRSKLLEGTLNSVVRAIGPTDSVEILIVDNGSVDGTTAICREIGKKFSRYEWRYVYEPMPGLLSGRHRGANEAQGEILAYLDDDVILSATWLDGLVDAFRDPEVTLVGGPCLPEYEVEPPEWLESLWQNDADGRRMVAELSLIDAGPSVRPEDPLYIFGLNFSIRKVIFDRCGGFHPDKVPTALERYRGDGETGLSLKVKAAGFRALYHPRVALKHVIPANRLTFKSIERRCFTQGISNSYTSIRREGTTLPRTWKDAVRPLKRRLHREYLRRNSDTQEIRGLMQLANKAGFGFHQNEVRSDPNLLQWVTKPNYFDYALPEGWRRHINSSNANL